MGDGGWKPDNPEENLSEQSREPATTPESNPGHIGGRQVLSPLPCAILAHK